MLVLCETLNLPFVAQAYPIATQDAAQQEAAYSDFLEGLLKAEAAGRKVRPRYVTVLRIRNLWPNGDEVRVILEPEDDEYLARDIQMVFAADAVDVIDRKWLTLHLVGPERIDTHWI